MRGRLGRLLQKHGLGVAFFVSAGLLFGYLMEWFGVWAAVACVVIQLGCGMAQLREERGTGRRTVAEVEGAGKGMEGRNFTKGAEEQQ